MNGLAYESLGNVKGVRQIPKINMSVGNCGIKLILRNELFYCPFIGAILMLLHDLERAAERVRGAGKNMPGFMCYGGVFLGLCRYQICVEEYTVIAVDFNCNCGSI